MKKLLALMLATLMLFGMVGFAAAENDDDNEVVRIAVGREIKALDGEYGANVGFNPYLHVFDPLVNVNGSSEIQPCLATEWERIGDTEWKFTLRKDVKFHDGSDFTAADVKYTFDRIATEDPKFNYAGNWGTAWPPETEVVDDYTVIIRYQAPQPLFLLLLPRIGILPENAVENNADFFISGLIGTGAYTFVSWDLGNTGAITLRSNPNYWDGCPDIETLIYESIPDASARALAFQSGEYDYVYELPYDQVEALSKLSGRHVEVKETVNLDYVVINPIPMEGVNDYLLDQNFRQALIYAVDHEPMAVALSAGYCHSINGLGMPFTKGYRAGFEYPERDPDKAKELLAASSYKGETIRIYAKSGEFYNCMVILEAMSTQLEEVGINCKFEEVDSGTWTSIRKSHDWEIGINNGGTTIGDASFYYTQNRTTFGYQTPECEAILAAMSDPNLSDEEYTKLIGDLLDTFMESNPFMWVCTCPYVYGVKDNITNTDFLPWGFPRFHKAVME